MLWHRQNDDRRKVERIVGIGPLTAGAYVASVGNAKAFTNGRQVAAWLGIVPRQDSSGGKPKLPGISKHGDVYLRTRVRCSDTSTVDPIRPIAGSNV